jgi:hypothetical protein
MVVVAWLEWLFGKQIVGDVAVTAVIAQNKRPAAVRLDPPISRRLKRWTV